MAEQNNNLSLKDVLTLIETINKASDERMMKAIAEIKKPSVEEQEKLDKEKARTIKKHQERVTEAKAEEEGRLAAQRACGMRNHTKRDGSPAWGGQINSDGQFRPICTQCRLVGPPIKAPREMYTSGVNLQDKEIFPRLTLEMLMAWHHSYGSHKASGCECEHIKPLLEAA
jgi:hypothetical protein